MRRELFSRHWLQRKLLVSNIGMHHGTCVTHMPWCMSGSPWRRGKRSRHYRRMRNPQFCVSGKRPWSSCTARQQDMLMQSHHSVHWSLIFTQEADLLKKTVIAGITSCPLLSKISSRNIFVNLTFMLTSKDPMASPDLTANETQYHNTFGTT